MLLLSTDQFVLKFCTMRVLIKVTIRRSRYERISETAQNRVESETKKELS